MPSEERLQEAGPQVIGRKGPGCGKPKSKTRIKTRHLSQITRQLVLDLFAALESSEEVATRLGVPARTVSDILTLAALRKEPQRPAPVSSGLHIVRRIAA